MSANGQETVTVYDMIPPQNVATIDQSGKTGNTYNKEQLDDKLIARESLGYIGEKSPGTITKTGNYFFKVISAGIYVVNGTTINVTEADINDNLEVQILVTDGVPRKKVVTKPNVSIELESQFNQEAEKYAVESYSEEKLISLDFSSTNIDAVSTSVSDNYFFKCEENLILSKVRVNVGSLQDGTLRILKINPTTKVKTTIKDVTGLTIGWNTINIDNVEIATGEWIGYERSNNSQSMISYNSSNTYGHGHLVGVNYVWDNDVSYLGEVFGKTKTKDFNSFAELVTPKSQMAGIDFGVFADLYFDKPAILSPYYDVKRKLSFLPYPYPFIQNDDSVEFSADDIITADGGITNFGYKQSIGIVFKSKTYNDQILYKGTAGANILEIGLSYSPNRIYVKLNGTNVINRNLDYLNQKISFVVTLTAAYVRLFINGTKTEVLHNAFNFVGDYDVQIGGGFIGELYRLTIWNRALSDVRAHEFNNTGNAYTSPSQFDKLSPQEGVAMDNPVKYNKYYNSEGESSLVFFKNKFLLYYTQQNNDYPLGQADVGIGVSVGMNPTDFTPYSMESVIGGKRGIAGINRFMGGYAVVSEDNSEVIFYGVDDYVQGATNNAKTFSSTDGFNFNLVGNFLPSTRRWANCSVYPKKQPNGYYYGIVEWMNHNTGIWEMSLVRSMSLKSEFEEVQVLPSLQSRPNSMYGGATLLKSKDEKTWMLWYHAGGDDTGATLGNLPTRGAFAICNEIEPKNWQIKDFPSFDMCDVATDRGATITDQIADTMIFEFEGKTYYYYALMQNTGGVTGQNKYAVFNGTKEELAGL